MFLAETKHNEVKNRLILCPLFKKKRGGGGHQSARDPLARSAGASVIWRTPPHARSTMPPLNKMQHLAVHRPHPSSSRHRVSLSNDSARASAATHGCQAGCARAAPREPSGGSRPEEGDVLTFCSFTRTHGQPVPGQSSECVSRVCVRGKSASFISHVLTSDADTHARRWDPALRAPRDPPGR